MKIKDFINEHKTYLKVEDEIRNWIEQTFDGLSIDFYPNNMEIVRIKDVEYAEEETKKIVEVVNKKIDEILEAHAEEIYFSNLLTRIWKKHPKFNVDVENIAELKRSKRFLKYLKELHIGGANGKVR